jgi:hypothetical protein
LQRNWKKLTGRGQQALATMLISLLLLLTASSAYASLHQRIHSENPDASHTCVICLLLQGHIDSADIVSAQCHFVLGQISSAPPVDTVAKSNIDLRLCPSRAPPRR